MGDVRLQVERQWVGGFSLQEAGQASEYMSSMRRMGCMVRKVSTRPKN